jgi:hypothetical protein
MAVAPLRVGDRLDGASKFLYWKQIFTLALKEYDLWKLVDQVVSPPKNLVALEAHKKKEIKLERVLLESVKDHLIPPLTMKTTEKYMFYSLVCLFQRKNMNMKMILSNKLISVQMSKSDNVTNHLMRIT